MLTEFLDKDDDGTKEMEIADNGDDGEDDVMKIINSTVDYIIAHDKKELLELLTQLTEEAIRGSVEELIATFFNEQKPNLPMIEELIRDLENS